MNQFPFNNRDFDRNFASHQKLVKRSMGAFVVLWLFWAALSLAGAGVVLYIIWHFVSKFW